MKRVVITGLGAITCIGSGKEGLWQGILRGESGIRPLTRFDASQFSSQIAGEVTDFDPLAHFEARRVKRLDRFAQLSLVAAKMAFEDAGLKPSADMGVCTGTALGGVALAEHQHELFLRQGLRAVNPALAFLVFGGSGGSHIAIELGLTGGGNTNSNSCASGTIAIGDAFRYLRAGQVTAMIAGAAEAPLAPLSFSAFDILHALSTRGCRSFDADRDGFVMGEGAAMLAMEEHDHALARGAHIYAEVLGYACNNDAYHMLAPRPDASVAVRCIRAALADAQLAPDAIGYINAHATGTPLGDKAEALAIQQVFCGSALPRATAPVAPGKALPQAEGPCRIPVSSTKPFHAHALGASGAIEAAICCLAIEHEYLPPTLNLEKPDNDLDCIPKVGRSARVDYVLSNSFGFGGINASLVLGRL